jgi:hypothetical protein
VQTPSARQAAGFVQRTAQRLAGLKKEYIAAYVGLHGKARLGVSEEKRRQALLRDPRRQQLDKLAAIQLLPAGQVAAWHNELTGLQNCTQLTEQELQATPLCPHCRFNPAFEKVAAPVGNVLAAMDGRLDEMVVSWTKVLLEHLEDPAMRESLELLSPAQKKRVNVFRKSRELPEKVDAQLVQAVQEVLSGFSKVVVKLGELGQALLEDGAPTTVEEIRARLDGYLERKLKGHDVTKVRLVLE